LALDVLPATSISQPAARFPVRHRRVTYALAAVLTVVVAVLVVWLRPDTATGGRPSIIAVFPFENHGPADAEYFAAGMTDEITSRLGAVSRLDVVPSRAAQRYDLSKMTMREIGRELGVDYVLVGSVRWESGSRSIRVTPALIRARDERQLWSNSYDQVIDDIFEVQSDIATEVIERLGVKLLAGGGWYSRLAPGETFPRAKHAALRALLFDSTVAEAHASMAHIHLEFDHDWEAAEREYRRAIELKPAYAIAHQWYGGFLSAMGRHEEALKHARIARDLDPLALIIQTWLGLRYYFAGNYDQAITEFLKALELDRDFAPAHWHLGMAYEQTGRFKEGIAEAKRAFAIDSGTLIYLASLGHAYARAGMKQQARATLARLAKASSNRHVSAYHVAVIHIALGDTKAGLDWLERAYDEQSPWIGYINVDPRVDPVRTHARFEAILRKGRLRS
ncbi:MAG: tetratricopeptide repeat protein, partial [Longimicrobiales bacterium]